MLGCNNYKVIDLGVMVSCDVILQRALEEKADIIGLSGLITPSLDEMVYVAKEMARRGMKQPLLIGGATTSRMHTAVKIAPQYSTLEHPVLYVLDASRSVTVVSALLDKDAPRREEYVQDVLDTYEELREEHYAGLEDRKYLTLAQSRARAPHYGWAAHAAPSAGLSVPWVPATPGVTVIRNVTIESLVPYIDWNPFFSVWELRGKYPNRGYPKIFADADVGSEAKRLFDDAQSMLKQIIDEKWLEPRGVVGIFPANAQGDDIL
ncbi:methionine synthase, partial [archaeon]